MLTFSTLALTLALSTQVSAKDFPDKPYSLKTKGTTTQVQKGAKGKFALQIVPAKGFKVSREAPMKIKLKSRNFEKLQRFSTFSTKSEEIRENLMKMNENDKSAKITTKIEKMHTF